jgi:hypothetical protein
MFNVSDFHSFRIAFARAATNDSSVLVSAYGEITPTFLERHGTLVIIGSSAFVILAVLAAWKMFQPKPAVILPPEALAREALAKLHGQSEDGKLLSDVSQILRRYVIAAFELPVAELTTAEFCDVIGTNTKVGADLAQAICSFLRECDQWKFSTENLTVPLNAANRALEFVSLAERRRAELRALTLPPR